MKLGKYIKTKPINFDKFTVSRFRFTLFDTRWSYVWGCGCIVGNLTGESPSEIMKLNGYKNHYSDKFMVNYLLSKKITVIPLTIANLTSDDSYETKLTKNHIILSSRALAKQKASWFLSFFGYTLHQNDINLMSSFDEYNMPILSSYLLFKRAWR